MHAAAPAPLPVCASAVSYNGAVLFARAASLLSALACFVQAGHSHLLLLPPPAVDDHQLGKTGLQRLRAKAVDEKAGKVSQ